MRPITRTCISVANRTGSKVVWEESLRRNIRLCIPALTRRDGLLPSLRRYAKLRIRQVSWLALRRRPSRGVRPSGLAASSCALTVTGVATEFHRIPFSPARRRAPDGPHNRGGTRTMSRPGSPGVKAGPAGNTYLGKLLCLISVLVSRGIGILNNVIPGLSRACRRAQRESAFPPMRSRARSPWKGAWVPV